MAISFLSNNKRNNSFYLSFNPFAHEFLLWCFDRTVLIDLGVTSNSAAACIDFPITRYCVRALASWTLFDCVPLCVCFLILHYKSGVWRNLSFFCNTNRARLACTHEQSSAGIWSADLQCLNYSLRTVPRSLHHKYSHLSFSGGEAAYNCQKNGKLYLRLCFYPSKRTFDL